MYLLTTPNYKIKLLYIDSPISSNVNNLAIQNKNTIDSNSDKNNKN